MMELFQPTTLAIELERIIVDPAQDHLPPLTVGLYEAFLAKGDPGRTALAAYQHLLYTYRRQGTNQPWATTRYLMAGLGMGRDKVKAAKALLHEMGLIEYIQRQGAKGRLGRTYTKLNLLPNPGPTAGLKSGTAEGISIPTAGLFDRPAVPPSSGARTQMLEEEINVLGEKINGKGGVDEVRTSEPALFPEPDEPLPFPEEEEAAHA
ncbi:MAG: hypothetical protein ABSB63_16110 [Spirochaetia bacterium]|jgi:hypothetical protein